jgi:hypothetical protein
MTSNTVTRLDPTNTVVDYEFLRVAHMLMVKQQNRGYWEGVPYPKRPIGQVKYERSRMVLTFLVPAVILVLAWFTHHLVGLFVGVPLAWFVGFVLDKMLARSVSEKLKRDIRIDSGRYRAVMWLSKHMGMAPEEITLPVIYKMAEDFRTVDAKMRAEEAQADAAREAAREAARAQRRTRRSRYEDRDRAADKSGNTVYVDDRSPAADDTYDYGHAPAVPGYSVNPNTGLPMNGPTDTMGNVYGTGSPFSN